MPYVRIPASDLKWSWNRSLITQQNKTYCTAIHLKNIKTKTHQCNIQLWFTQNDNIVRFFVSHVCMHFKLARHCTLVHFLESKGKKCHRIFEKNQFNISNLYFFELLRKCREPFQIWTYFFAFRPNCMKKWVPYFLI